MTLRVVFLSALRHHEGRFAQHLLSRSTKPFQRYERLYGSASDMQQPIIFRQLFEHKSYTYTYLLACLKTKEAALIDPVIEMVGRDAKLLNQLGLNLKYAINTHVHADHITGSGKLKSLIAGSKSVLGVDSGAKADIHMDQGEKLMIGDIELECRKTPGHTNDLYLVLGDPTFHQLHQLCSMTRYIVNPKRKFNARILIVDIGCMSYVWHDKGCVFSGDAVLIRGCGRTDFQQGNAERLYQSVHSQIFSLPESYQIYPAHDYTGQLWSTVGEEKQHNPRLTKTVNEFVKLMNNLNLPYPKQIDRALPANLLCGIYDDDGELVKD